MTHLEHDAEIEAGSTYLRGPMLFEYRVEAFLDADIGGFDGDGVVDCRVVSFDPNGLCITRERLVESMTRAQVAELYIHEARMADRLQTSLMQGDPEDVL